MKEIKWIVGINLGVFLLISFVMYFDCRKWDCETFQYAMRMTFISVLQVGMCILAGFSAFVNRSKKYGIAFLLAALAIFLVGVSFCGVAVNKMKPIDRMKGQVKQGIDSKG